MALAAAARPAAAQDAAVEMANHPIVGAWVSPFDAVNPGTMFQYVIFHADGTRVDEHPFAGTGIGAWRPTGARTGETILRYQNIAGEWGGFEPGMVTVWGSFTVDETGNVHASDDVVELRQPDGTVLDRFAFTARFTRLAVEPAPALGTPEAGTPTT
jgi:hypothetical protein